MNAALRPASPALQSGQPLAGGLRALFAFFREHQRDASPLVLATVVATHGTTYRKRGAQMLIRNDNHWHGLLSGGCLEGDLAAHASEVFASGSPKIVEYELAAMTDAVWGFGLGCDGSVRILLQRLDAANAWEPFASLVRAVEHGAQGRLILLCESTDDGSHIGAWSLEIAGHPALGQLSLPRPLPAGFSTRMAEQIAINSSGHSYVCVGVPLPCLYRLVILGGGPDALPLVQFAAQLGWHVAVVDHRAGYAEPERFPAADRVIHALEQNLPDDFDLSASDAIVIMSHNLSADERYLAQAVRSRARYIGLLGPAARKHKLLASLDAAAEPEGRVHGPVGLDLGGEGPEAIALSIVAEIQAMLHGKAAVGRKK
jgi:xanthine/CO dehydrogenase XdhC/CoxF family maturation factor